MNGAFYHCLYRLKVARKFRARYPEWAAANSCPYDFTLRARGTLIERALRAAGVWRGSRADERR